MFYKTACADLALAITSNQWSMKATTVHETQVWVSPAILPGPRDINGQGIWQQTPTFSLPAPGENHSISPVASLAGLSDILTFLSSIVITSASKSTNQPDSTNRFFPMGPSEHLPFPVPSKKSQPSTKDWVFALCRFYWSKSVLGRRPCIGSVSPRRLGQEE